MNPWYLTGFADGESFFITRPLIRKGTKGQYTSSITFRWGIQVRGDEEDLIYDIKTFLDNNPYGSVGSIYHRQRKGDISPQVTLHYDGILNSKVIREHFREYPLLGKKAKDFKAWAEVFDKTEEYMSDERFTYRYFGDYPEDVLEKRVELAHLTDKVRLVRLNADSQMRNVSKRELLRQAGGQEKLYAEILLEKFLETGQITIEQFNELNNKYGMKI
jgi:hypothetical protein